MINSKGHLLSFSATYFFIYAAVASLFPFFPLLLQNKGFNPSQVGFLMGSYDLVSIAGLLTIGFLYDRNKSPRRTIISVGLISTTLLFLLASSYSSLWLIIFTLILGFFVKSPTSLLDAMYGQTMKNPQETYGKIRLSGSLGFFASALLIKMTHWVQGSRPFSVFSGYSISMIITLILLLLLPSEKLDKTEKPATEISFLQSIRSFPAIFWIGLVIAFLSSLSLSGHYTFFSLLLKNKFHLEDVSGFWAIGPILEIPLFFFSGYLIRKFKLRTLWIVCLLAGISRMQVYSLAGTLLPLYLVQLLHSLSFGLNHLCMINLIGRKTHPASRGLAMSIYTAIGMGLSMFTGGIIGGFILRTGEFTQLFQIFSIFPLVAIAVTLIFLKE